MLKMNGFWMERLGEFLFFFGKLFFIFTVENEVICTDVGLFINLVSIRWVCFFGGGYSRGKVASFVFLDFSFLGVYGLGWGKCIIT